MTCPACGGESIRTFSHFNKQADRWEWWKGCNSCPWQQRDLAEETKHPECYERTEISPAKISSEDDLNGSK